MHDALMLGLSKFRVKEKAKHVKMVKASHDLGEKVETYACITQLGLSS